MSLEDAYKIILPEKVEDDPVLKKVVEEILSGKV